MTHLHVGKSLTSMYNIWFIGQNNYYYFWLIFTWGAATTSVAYANIGAQLNKSCA